MVDCDESGYGCAGGYVNKVLHWGRNKGFILEECMEYNGYQSECEVDHEESNPCRVENEIYRVRDYCVTPGEENIKRELFKNGPVVAQMTVYSDFLSYKGGIYHRTKGAIKFEGSHIVKIVGWNKDVDGSTQWIIENSWGADWGENGYGIVSSKGDTEIQEYGMGMEVLD